MKLSRRDALAALASVGAGAVAGCSAFEGADDSTEGQDGNLDEDTLDTLVAAAAVLYPSSVEGADEFVRTYAMGRVATDDAHREGLAAATDDLDSLARDWEGAAFADLGVAARDRLLHESGADIADPDPDGPLAERLRYYVVNDLLYAFYASPTGGKLVGIENPVGYPGGTESYQQPPIDQQGGESDG